MSSKRRATKDCASRVAEVERSQRRSGHRVPMLRKERNTWSPHQSTSRDRRLSVRLPRRGRLRLQERARADPRQGRADLEDEGRARVDARVPPEGATTTSSSARCRTGARDLPGSISTTSSTTSSPAEKQGKTWDEVPDYIKNTFEKLGIPEAERKFLAGVGAQYESRSHLPLAARGSGEAGRDLPRHGLGACASTRSWSSSTSARSSRPTTTSSPR